MEVLLSPLKISTLQTALFKFILRFGGRLSTLKPCKLLTNPPSLLPPLEDTLENILDHLQELREERLVEIGHQKEGTNLQKYYTLDR